MTDTPLHHTAVVTIRRGHDTAAHEARCSCGWRGRPRPTEQEAEHDATDHVAAIT